MTRRKSTLHTSLLSGTALLTATLSATSLSAQETPFVLDEIVVESRKIEEPLQRVPFGISVQSAQSIEDRRIRDVNDLARVTPGLNLGDTGLRGSNIPNIRGVGSFFPLSADDASAPVFIDGVPLAVRSQDREFLDVDRVEVLRGPQNLTFGRNAQAGAINVITADPTFTPEFLLGLEAGSDDYARLRAIASGPLSETVAGRVALKFETRDGDIDDINRNEVLRGEDLATASAKLLWQPSAATDVRLLLRYEDYDEVATQGVYLEDSDFPRAFLDIEPEYEFRARGAGLTVEHDLGFATLTSVTGYQEYETFYRADDSDGLLLGAITGLPPEFFNDPTSDFREIGDEDRQISQEFRLDGETAGGLVYVVGVNAFRAELDFDLLFNFTGAINGTFDNTFTTTSYSAFGELTQPIGDRLAIFGGLRYTLEEKEFSSDFTDQSGGTLGMDSSDSGSESFDFVTGRVGLTYDITPDMTAFATLARGAKSGGFQLADTDQPFGGSVSRYETAITDTAEIGIRGTTLNDRLYLSASAFFNDTENEHVQVFDVLANQGVIENIDTETYGLEVEAAYEVTPNFALGGSLALLETEITGSDDPTVEEGNEVPFAPDVTFSIAAEYRDDLTLFGRDGTFSARAEYSYVGERAADPQNNFTFDSYEVVDLRVGWQGGALEVYAFVENAFDEDYAESGFLFGQTPTGGLASIGIPGAPRQVGVGLNVRF
ncbi:MAG: TonB-dependent receptor [Pseudomonadota bacterium]